MTPAPTILMLSKRRRQSGGAISIFSNCPQSGSNGEIELYAEDTFNPNLYVPDGWTVPTSFPDSSVGIEESYGVPDSTPYVATIAAIAENPFDAAWGYQLNPVTEYAECPIEYIGGTVTVVLTDLTGSSSGSLVNLSMIFDDGMSYAYFASSSGTGAQTITGVLTAAQATQIAEGHSPGVVLLAYRDGVVDTVVSVDAIVVALDWQVT